MVSFATVLAQKARLPAVSAATRQFDPVRFHPATVTETPLLTPAKSLLGDGIKFWAEQARQHLVALLQEKKEKMFEVAGRLSLQR
jgi:hypothetical protein